MKLSASPWISVVSALLLTVALEDAKSPRLQAADGAAETAVIVELRDGSRLVGSLLETALEFESEVLGQLRVQWTRVDELVREGDPPRLVLRTRSGDRSTGDLVAKELRFRASFGEIALPREAVLTIRPKRPLDRTGLLHHWEGERDARDSVGGAHGDTAPNVQFTAGHKGRAFTFAGMGEGVRFDKDVARFGTDDFSITFWLRASKPQLIQYPISKRANCAPVACWEIRVEPTGQISFVLATLEPEFQSQHTVSKGVATDDSWHHVVVTRNERKVTLYLDGKRDVSEEGKRVFDVSNRAPLRFGTGVCAGQGGSTHFDGQLDEVRIFNRALTDAEVGELFITEKGR
jgi:hypothetical protein